MQFNIFKDALERCFFAVALKELSYGSKEQINIDLLSVLNVMEDRFITIFKRDILNGRNMDYYEFSAKNDKYTIEIRTSIEQGEYIINKYLI